MKSQKVVFNQFPIKKSFLSAWPLVIESEWRKWGLGRWGWSCRDYSFPYKWAGKSMAVSQDSLLTTRWARGEATFTFFILLSLQLIVMLIKLCLILLSERACRVQMLLSYNKLESSSYSLPPSKHKPLVAEITRVTTSPRTQWHFLVLAIHLHECQDTLSFCVSFHKQTGCWWLLPEPEIARLLFQISIYLIFNNQTPIKCHAGRWYFYFVCSDW